MTDDLIEHVRDALDDAIEIRVICSCEEEPVFEATVEGYNQASQHKADHGLKEPSAIRFVY